MAATSNPAPRLLIADDEEGLLFLMCDALKREGCEVHGCASGAEALKWLSNHRADLILLDLKLSDLSALEVVQRLREDGMDAPFIIVTGHGDERTAVEAMKHGALDYVMKDAGMIELLPVVVRRALSVGERERMLVEANEAARKGEQRNRHIIHTALDGFVRFRGDGRILEVNKALSDLLGATPQALLKRNAFESEGETFRAEVRNQVERLDVDGAARCFTRLMHNDGSEIDVEISLRREGDEFFAFVHDVSAQRRLERQIQQSLEEERRRFGHELHDNLGQQLTALEMMTSSLARELKPSAPAKAKQASEIAAYIRRAVSQTRELAHTLLPTGAEREGLMNALQELARMTTAAGVPCEFQCTQPVHIEDATMTANLYRIAQEAVTNSLKHAKARHIVLGLSDAGSRIEISIKDDGKGLSLRKSESNGMGLQVMQHRARLIGGVLDVQSEAKKGVRIVCAIPKKQ